MSDDRDWQPVAGWSLQPGHGVAGANALVRRNITDCASMQLATLPQYLQQFLMVM